MGDGIERTGGGKPGRDGRVDRLFDDVRIRSQLEGQIGLRIARREAAPFQDGPVRRACGIDEAGRDDVGVVVLQGLGPRRDVRRVFVDDTLLDVDDHQAASAVRRHGGPSRSFSKDIS